MTHYYSADACEDDSIIVQANEQLTGELLQSQEKPARRIPSLPTRCVSRNLYWLRQRLDTYICFSGIVSKLVRADRHPSLDKGCFTQERCILERFELDR